MIELPAGSLKKISLSFGSVIVLAMMRLSVSSDNMAFSIVDFFCNQLIILYLCFLIVLFVGKIDGKKYKWVHYIGAIVVAILIITIADMRLSKEIGPAGTVYTNNTDQFICSLENPQIISKEVGRDCLPSKIRMIGESKTKRSFNRPWELMNSYIFSYSIYESRLFPDVEYIKFHGYKFGDKPTQKQPILSN